MCTGVVKMSSFCCVCYRRESFLCTLILQVIALILLCVFFLSGNRPYYRPGGQLHGKTGLLHQQWSKVTLNQSYKGFQADEEPSHNHTEERWQAKEPRKRYSYVLSYTYMEQLTSAGNNYVSFINFAAKWNLRTVEPLVSDSRLFGLTRIRTPYEKQAPIYNYSSLFNLTQVNERLSNCLAKQSPLIFSMHEFISNSHTNLTVIYFVQKKPIPVVTGLVNSGMHAAFHKKLNSVEGEDVVDCTAVARNMGLPDAVHNLFNAQTEGAKQFFVTTTVCVRAMQASVSTIESTISSSLNQNKSIFFIYWHKDEIKKLQNSCRVYPIPHSKEVLETAGRFLQSLEVKRPFLSIHMRTERVIQHEPSHPGYIDSCIEELPFVINRTLHRHNLKDVLVLRDYGMYGSDSCHYGNHSKPRQFCKSLSDKFVSRLQQWNIQVVDFEPAAFDGVPHNSGFVSLVEADALLQGDVLVTVGYGNFQQALRTRFAEKSKLTSEECCYSVCSHVIN